MTSRTLIFSLFLLACDETPQTLDEVIESTTPDPSRFDPGESTSYRMSGTWDEIDHITLATGELRHGVLQVDADGQWTDSAGNPALGDLMIHQSYEGRYGTIASIQPLNGATLCQYRAGATQMLDITQGRCGLATLGCDPVDGIYLDHLFYAELPDSARMDALLVDLELNGYRVTDASGQAFEMIVHDRGFTNATDPWVPGEVTVELEVLGLASL